MGVLRIMAVSRKCQYAVRALFELARRSGSGPTTIAQIARAQAIPVKFLELILGELKKGGFVQSRRGPRGGYVLIGEPGDLAVGKVISLVDGPVAPIQCVSADRSPKCPLVDACVFSDMWSRARDAVAKVYDETSFQDLLDLAVTTGDCNTAGAGMAGDALRTQDPVI